VSLWTALAPVLTHRTGARGVAFFLHIHLYAHGWQGEVERHQCTLKRIEALLGNRNEPLTVQKQRIKMVHEPVVGEQE